MEDITNVKREVVDCSKCCELESKCIKLESEIEKEKSQFEKLEVKFLELEEELKAMKRGKQRSELSSGIVDLTGDEEGDVVARLMIENRVLECEKQKAESEAESLKLRLKEMESRICNEAVEGAPCNKTPSKHIICMEREKGSVNLKSKAECSRRVRKNLAFEEDRSPPKKMAPSTPNGIISAASFGVIDIRDSDDETDVTCIHSPFEDKNICVSTDRPSERTMGSDKESTPDILPKTRHFLDSYEDNFDACNDIMPILVTSKRKRASNIVTSDTESDEDDVPIGKLKSCNLQETVSDIASSEMKLCSVTDAPLGNDNIESPITPPRRRLRKCTEKIAGEKSSSSMIHETKGQQGIPKNEDIEDEESDSDSDSFHGFIVDDTEYSDSGSASSEVQDDSDDNVSFGEILSRIKRTKDQNLEWEFEADMLAAFGKDSELCMKAVCALYRQQTSDEKVCKESLVYNSRGFSKFDAHRGTMLAEFLTDGDPEGDLKKSVEELQAHDSKAVELCRTFANRYSKQLFEIYKNKEDPHFP